MTVTKWFHKPGVKMRWNNAQASHTGRIINVAGHQLFYDYNKRRRDKLSLLHPWHFCLLGPDRIWCLVALSSTKGRGLGGGGEGSGPTQESSQISQYYRTEEKTALASLPCCILTGGRTTQKVHEQRQGVHPKLYGIQTCRKGPRRNQPPRGLGGHDSQERDQRGLHVPSGPREPQGPLTQGWGWRRAARNINQSEGLALSDKWGKGQGRLVWFGNTEDADCLWGLSSPQLPPPPLSFSSCDTDA